MVSYGVIVIDTDSNIRIQHVRNKRVVLSEIRELISNNCKSVQMVRPVGLFADYDFLKSMFDDVDSERGILMLVDKEGKFKSNKVNRVGSFLHRSNLNNDYITGNVVFVACEYFEDFEWDFAGWDMSDEDFIKLYTVLKGICDTVKK